MTFLKKFPPILLGIIYIAFSLQFFAMLIWGGAMPEMNEMATMFMTVWFASGFVFITKIIELAAGVLLVIPRTRALGLIIITPITVGIILTEILIVKSGFVVMLPALVITILNIIGIYQYREKYLPMVR